MVDIRSIVFRTAIFQVPELKKTSLKSFSARVPRLQCFFNGPYALADGAMHFVSKKISVRRLKQTRVPKIMQAMMRSAKLAKSYFFQFSSFQYLGARRPSCLHQFPPAHIPI